MGNACSSTSKKNQKENISDTNATNAYSSDKNRTNIEIDVVPDDQIPKDLIERTLKKVDTADVDDDLMDLNSPLTQVIKKFIQIIIRIKRFIERNGEKKKRKESEKSGKS